MKLVIEIETLEHGKGEKTSWTKLRGRNSNGSYKKAIAWGAVAESLYKELYAHVPKGEEIGSMRIVVDMTGEWETRKWEQDGKERRDNRFKVATFEILTGPILELARLRRDGAARLELAEEHRKEGRLELAYKTVAEFAAQVCNRPIDLSDIEDFSDDDDAEFGSVSDGQPDPEAAAAARYAAMDGPSEPMEIAQDHPAEIVQEASDVAVEEPRAETSASDAADMAREEGADDVLEDGNEAVTAAAKPAAPAPARPPVPVRPLPPVRPAQQAAASGSATEASKKPDQPRMPFRAPPPRPRTPGM